MTTGLRYDEVNDLFHGVRDGFDFIAYAADANQPFALVLHTAAKSADGSVLDKKTIKAFQKSCKSVGYLGQKNMDIRVTVPAAKNLQNAVNECITATTAFLRANGYSPCCDLCGQNVETGALLGSLLGALSILVLSQLGYVAALSGAIMAVCVLKGYEMLGGKLTKKAIVISVIIMILMTYFGDRVDWAIILFRDAGAGEAGYNIFECYRLVPYALTEEIIDIGSYLGNLFLLYLFVALGAVPAIRGKLKEKKEEGIITRLN